MSSKNIVFIGFMAAGKTQMAAEFAAATNRQHSDTDQMLAEQFGRSIELIFQDQEDAFRVAEEDLLSQLLEKESQVISLGAGAIESEKVQELLTSQICVYCRVSEEAAWQRAIDSNRPLAKDRETFKALHRDREGLYQFLSDVTLPIDFQPAQNTWQQLAASLELLSSTDDDAALVWISSKISPDYPVVIGRQALAALASPAIKDLLGSDSQLDYRLVVDQGAWDAVDESTKSFLHSQSQTLVHFNASEDNKNLAHVENIVEQLAVAGSKTDDLLVAFGGGVTTDLVGFAAASFQRLGLPLALIPTTLLGQVDAAYGGKTGVNIPSAKNWIGAYHPPRLVLSDLELLETLPAEEKSSAFAEVIKTALIAPDDGALWRYLQRLDEPITSSAFDLSALAHIIRQSVIISTDIIGEDPMDSHKRLLLNFGHTVGHSIESATDYKGYGHGQAIGLGMLAALELSELPRLRQQVKEMLAYHQLPTQLNADEDKMIKAMYMDKKNTTISSEGTIAFVLLDDVSKSRESVLTLLPEQTVRQAIRQLKTNSA